MIDQRKHSNRSMHNFGVCLCVGGITLIFLCALLGYQKRYGNKPTVEVQLVPLAPAEVQTPKASDNSTSTPAVQEKKKVSIQMNLDPNLKSE